MDSRTKVYLDRKKRIVHITLEGRHTDRTIVAAVTSSARQPGMHRLWDVRNADLRALDFPVIVGMTHDLAALPPIEGGARIAIVAASDLQFGLSRMCQALMEGAIPATLRVFRTVEDGEAWLAEPARD
jgi:hypothetical protein